MERRPVPGGGERRLVVEAEIIAKPDDVDAQRRILSGGS